MAEQYLPVALAKRIAQARQRVESPAAGDSQWTLELLGHLADEAEAAQRHIQDKGQD